MNMTKKGYTFVDENFVEEEVFAASLAEATSKLPEDFFYKTYYIEDLYHIAKMNEEGKWEILESFWTYNAADDKVDYYCDKYSFANVDILYKGEVVD